MALDWNKEVGLSTVLDLARPGKNGSAGSSAFPSKTTMNLYQGDETTTDVRKVGLTAILLALAIATFVKFGVIDQLSALSQKEGELAEQQAQLAEASQLASDYDELKETYEGYLLSLGDGSPDAINVLALVEDRVKSRAAVTNITLSNPTLTLALSDVSLDLVGDIARDLRSQPLVESVNVSTATKRDADAAGTHYSSATLVITLVSAVDEEA